MLAISTPKNFIALFFFKFFNPFHTQNDHENWPQRAKLTPRMNDYRAPAKIDLRGQDWQREWTITGHPRKLTSEGKIDNENGRLQDTRENWPQRAKLTTRMDDYRAPASAGRRWQKWRPNYNSSAKARTGRGASTIRLGLLRAGATISSRRLKIFLWSFSLSLYTVPEWCDNYWCLPGVNSAYCLMAKNK